MRASLPATIEIRQDLRATHDLIHADPTQIHQVLMNLCANAGQAMKDREGVLEITMWNQGVEPDDLLEHPLLKQGSYLVLSVKDTGLGIAKENLDRIFEPYFTTKGPGEGTGLGLAVAHGIIKGCGGDIRVYSEPGKGTVFHVYLPLSQAAAGQQSQTALEPPRGSERILFVDDEQTIVDIATVMLEGLGYTVAAYATLARPFCCSGKCPQPLILW
jgi:signal transduction histidine kinase